MLPRSDEMSIACLRNHSLVQPAVREVRTTTNFLTNQRILYQYFVFGVGLVRRKAEFVQIRPKPFADSFPQKITRGISDFNVRFFISHVEEESEVCPPNIKVASDVIGYSRLQCPLQGGFGVGLKTFVYGNRLHVNI